MIGDGEFTGDVVQSAAQKFNNFNAKLALRLARMLCVPQTIDLKSVTATYEGTIMRVIALRKIEVF